MDWQALAKQVMGNYDGVWQKAMASKRGAKAQQAPAESEPPGDLPADAEPDADSDDAGMDDETKAKLMQLLSE